MGSLLGRFFFSWLNLVRWLNLFLKWLKIVLFGLLVAKF
jgi:hypothetical protein